MPNGQVVQLTHTGTEGDSPLEVRADGFSPSPQARRIIKYTATVKANSWIEIGERIVEGQTPVRIFEMNLLRIGMTGWPQKETVPRE